MNEKIKVFLLKAEEDKELQAKLSQIRDPEEAYKLASGLVDGFTKEEFIAEMTKLYESQLQDLSEEDIAKVVGGVSDAEFAISLVATVAGHVAIGAAAL